MCAGALGVYVVLYISAGGNSKGKQLSEIEHMSERAHIYTRARAKQQKREQRLTTIKCTPH